MRTEKRIYVKPYTAVLNVQTEGVIAASGGEIITDYSNLCKSNYISGVNSCTTNTCTIQDHISSCNQVNSTTKIYATCYKERDGIYHVQVIEDHDKIGYVDANDIIKLSPCNCLKNK